MSERSIAEIIGWEWHGQRVYRYDRILPEWTPGDYYGAETGRGTWWPPGVSYSDGSPPNVDDMVAWLLSRPAFVFENKWWGPMTMWGSKRGFIVQMTDSDGDEVASDCKPTLREALEQMVRLIDDHDTETT